ncbi:MAG: Gfo/Idh/MocA family oxidoreductase [Rhodoluna sp.]|nr:Gfo/Idh/MocA family oxidoreductase [Rhodoluna sp.]
MSQTLRAGIVGAGFMAVVHAKAIRNAGHELTAIASSTGESAAIAAEKLGVANVFNTWQELVASELVDVVHICTPNELHATITIAAAKANKQIVCEKPISVTYEEALAIQEEVTKADVGFAVPFAYRFYPLVREMKARLQNGEAGAVHLLHGSYLQDWLATPTSNNWRVNSASGGASRAFADVGTHWCDLMEFVTGDQISRLIANTSKAYESRNGVKVQTEDIATILFETKGGATGTLTVSQVSFGRKNQLLLEVDGSKASYTFNQEQPEVLLVGGSASNQIVTRGQENLTSADARRLSHVPAGHPQGYQDAFNNFISDAYAGFQGNPVQGTPGLADGVRAAALIEAVLTSASQQAWVTVLDSGTPSQTKMLAS